MLVIILLCLTLCGVVIVRARLLDAKSHKLPPAFPGELPIIGHTHMFAVCNNKTLFGLLKKIAASSIENGGLIYIQLGKHIYYCITDPEDAYTVANSCLQKHFMYGFANNWLGQGLITASGEIYNRHRKLLYAGYTVSVIHSYLQVFNSQAYKLVNEINSHLENGAFDPLPMIKNITLETTCLTTFGFNKKEFQNYMHTVDELMHILLQRFTRVFLQNQFIYRCVGLQKQEDLLVKNLKKLSNEAIQQRKAAMEEYKYNSYEQSEIINNPDITYKPMLNFLVKLHMDGLLTKDEIREELDTNIAAAYDTTTYTLTNMLLLLGTYPNVQEKIYEELIQVLGTVVDVEKQDLQKLVYTKAVIKECLRVIPTVPILARYIDKEVKLKNYTMRAGSQCFIFIMGIHCNADWGPDAQKFKPERWLDSATLPSNANSFAGFSMGKRACIGMTYAITSLTVMLVHLVRHYKWTADITKVEMKLDITLQPSTGHEVIFERR